MSEYFNGYNILTRTGPVFVTGTTLSNITSCLSGLTILELNKTKIKISLGGVPCVPTTEAEIGLKQSLNEACQYQLGSRNFMIHSSEGKNQVLIFFVLVHIQYVDV